MAAKLKPRAPSPASNSLALLLSNLLPVLTERAYRSLKPVIPTYGLYLQLAGAWVGEVPA